MPAGFVLKSQGSTRARLVLDPSSSLNGALLKAPNFEENISSVLRRIKGMPIICSADIQEAYFRLRISPEAKLSSLFLMDFDTQTKQLTAKVTQHSKLVTIQTKVSIMGVNQSGSFLSLSLQDLTKDIQDPILRYFLCYLRYLDDLQSGVVAEEIEELQKGINLKDPALEMQCQDYDCCKHGADLPATPGNMLGGALPEDEKRCTRHLLYNTMFGKALLHKIVLKAATLETALARADMPTKRTQTLH